jgi:hypothetical protein
MSWSDLLQSHCMVTDIMFYFWHVIYLAVDKGGACALRNPWGISMFYFLDCSLEVTIDLRRSATDGLRTRFIGFLSL